MGHRGLSLALVVAVAATVTLTACTAAPPVVEPRPVVEPVETRPVVEPVETPPVVEPVETPPVVEPVETLPANPLPTTTDGTVDLSVSGALPAAGQAPTLGDATFPGPAPFVVGQPGVAAQLAYLHAHWNSYNGAYRDFNAWGGDCQNFVSQSLIARGWPMTWEWYYDTAVDSWAAAWVHVPSFNSWLNANRAAYGATPVAFSDRSQIKVGDLVVFDWDNNGSLDHIQVVSRVSVVAGAVRIEMIGHNNDVEFRDLDRTITVDHPGATGWFWSLDY